MSLPTPARIFHVGLTVPDTKAACDFFAEVFGAILEPRTDGVLMTEFKAMPPIQFRGVQGVARTSGFMMSMPGGGAQLEVFDVDKTTLAAANATQAPAATIADLGLQHLGIYVTEIAAAVVRAERRGAKRLGGMREIRLGRRVQKMTTPWGTLLELVTRDEREQPFIYHVGLTVPDAPAAADFFVNVFDCTREPLSEGQRAEALFPIDPEMNGVPPNTLRSTPLFVTAPGGGPQLAIYEVRSDAQRPAASYGDLGLHHIGFFITSLEETCERIERNGGTPLGRPVHRPVVVGPGIHLHYDDNPPVPSRKSRLMFAPWGTMVELSTRVLPEGTLMPSGAACVHRMDGS